MTRRIAGAILFLCALLALDVAASGPGAVTTPMQIVRAETTKSFADVILELEFAITERNFRITGRNTIGEGLRARGYADFPDVEVIHFCNLEQARTVLLVDPDFVAQMPCRISVHEANGRTVINVVLLPEEHPDPRVTAFAREVNASLRGILAFVLEADL